MRGFRHILFPVDFSERCAVVRPLVQATARQFDAKLTLLYVTQIPIAWYGGGIGAAYPVTYDVGAMMDDARVQLDRFLEWEGTPAPGEFEKIVVEGDPATNITNFAEANGVDLIMMPTHGYGRFRRFLLGSVTAKVLHDAKVPVWTSAQDDELALTEHLSCKSMMCAIDTTPRSVDIIRYAAELAEAYGAKLRLVHAVPAAEAGSIADAGESFDQFLLHVGRQRVTALQTEANTTLEICLDGGPVPAVVRAAAMHHEANLVVIGRGRQDEFLGRLRTQAYSIIRDAPCPVLSV